VFQQPRRLALSRPGQASVPVPQNPLELVAHNEEILHLPFHLLELGLRHHPDSLTRHSTLVTNAQDCLKFGQGKAGAQSAANQTDAFHRLRRVVSVPAPRARWRRQKAETLIVPHRVWAYSDEARQLSGSHRFSHSMKVYTLEPVPRSSAFLRNLSLVGTLHPGSGTKSRKSEIFFFLLRNSKQIEDLARKGGRQMP